MMHLRTAACWVIAVAVATTSAVSRTWSECPEQATQGEPSSALVPFHSPEVTQLNLINCHITLDSTSFKNIPNIQVLHLIDNRIRSLDINFKSIPKLEEMYISNNKIHVQAIPRLKFPILKKITITNTKMESEMNSLPGDSLEILEMSNCSLATIPIYGKYDHLKKLILSRNHIKNLDSDNALEALNLSELDVSYNMIEIIEKCFFDGLIEIVTINLSNNRLKHLPDNLFGGLQKLLLINLRKNLIDYIPANLFEGTSPITVDLSHNTLTYLPDDFIGAFPGNRNKMTDLYLDHNPWQCRCLNDILVHFKRQKINIDYGGSTAEFKGKEPVCVMAGFHCYKPESHLKFYKKMKEKYEKLITVY